MEKKSLLFLISFLMVFSFTKTSFAKSDRLLFEINSGYLQQFKKINEQKRDITGVHADLNMGILLNKSLFLDIRLLNVDNSLPDFIPIPILFMPVGLRGVVKVFNTFALEFSGGYQYMSFMKLSHFGKDFNFKDLNEDKDKSCIPNDASSKNLNSKNTCKYQVGDISLEGHYPETLKTKGKIYLRSGLYFNVSKNFFPHFFAEYSRIFLHKYYENIKDFEFFILGVGFSL